MGIKQKIENDDVKINEKLANKTPEEKEQWRRDEKKRFWEYIIVCILDYFTYMY